ncbi:hypothetical protein TcWFU_007989 [Taenia crassiceps]|uniref:Uncharacterized protein n=1 Tax=Taenia crassiceps TaxID=6207 RepID=A0ABR4QHM0_9CEST
MLTWTGRSWARLRWLERPRIGVHHVGETKTGPGLSHWAGDVCVTHANDFDLPTSTPPRATLQTTTVVLAATWARDRRLVKHKARKLIIQALELG